MCCIALCYTHTAVELLLPQTKLKEAKEDVSISRTCIQYHRHQLPTRLLGHVLLVATNAPIRQGGKSAILSTTGGGRGKKPYARNHDFCICLSYWRF